MLIKVYHTDNGIFNTSKFMKYILNEHKKISFIGDGASHQNGEAECNIDMVVTITSTMLMHTVLICHKDTLYNDFGQW